MKYLGPRQRWSWKEKAVPGTNIEWLMTEGNLAPTTEGVGILGHANHIKAQSVGLTVGKSCWCLDLTCTTCAVWQASSRHSWFLTVGPLSQGLIINMPEIRPPFFFSFFFFIYVFFLQKTSATDWGPAFNPLSHY